MDKIKIWFFNFIILFIVSLLIVYSTLALDIMINKTIKQSEDKQLEDGKMIFIKSDLGCLPLQNKYTEEEWEAKEELFRKIEEERRQQSLPIMQRCK